MNCKATTRHVQTSIQTITPDEAEVMLKKNTRNRPICPATVKELSREMIEGKWKLNGDTLCFSGDALIDGQHRLLACIKSGVPFTTLVVDGVEADVFATKDSGKRRSAADTLSVQGETNAAAISAALVIVDKYLTTRMMSSVVYTNGDILGILEKHPDIRASVPICTRHKRAILRPSISIALHYMFSILDKAAADKWIERIHKGAGLEEGSPTYLLRERLVANTMSNAKLPKHIIIALCVKAWNAERSGTKIKQLKYIDGEPFPIIR